MENRERGPERGQLVSEGDKNYGIDNAKANSVTKFENKAHQAIRGENNPHIEVGFLLEEAMLSFQSETLQLKKKKSVVESDLRGLEDAILDKDPSVWLGQLVAKKKEIAMIGVEEKILAEIGREWFNM